MRQQKLHTPAKTSTGTAWCGPFALGAITGKTYEQCCRALNRAAGIKSTFKVRGVHTRHLIKALDHWGWQVVEVYKQNPVKRIVPTHRGRRLVAQDPITLGQWVDNHRQGTLRYDLLLIVAGWHFQVVRGSEFIDNHQQTPVNTDKAHSRRYEVKRVLQITRKPRKTAK